MFHVLVRKQGRSLSWSSLTSGTRGRLIIHVYERDHGATFPDAFAALARTFARRTELFRLVPDDPAQPLPEIPEIVAVRPHESHELQDEAAAKQPLPAIPLERLCVPFIPWKQAEIQTRCRGRFIF